MEQRIDKLFESLALCRVSVDLFMIVYLYILVGRVDGLCVLTSDVMIDCLTVIILVQAGLIFVSNVSNLRSFLVNNLIH